MRILLVELEKSTISELDDREDQGLTLGLRLLDEYGADSFVLSSPSKESIDTSNSSVFTISYVSPITHKKAFAYANNAIGLSMVQLNIKAIVFTGKANNMCYLSLYQSKEEILPCEFMRGGYSSYFEEVCPKSKLDSVLSSSRAADNGIKFTDLMSRGKYVIGSGLGYVFSSHNLKGIVMQGFNYVSPSSKYSDKVKRITERSDFARRVRKNGANVFVDDALRLGWLPVDSYKRGFDPRAYSLDGKGVLEKYGNFPDSCQECFFSCGRRGKKEEIVPSWNECMMLGTNLGFYSFDSISPIVDKARLEGIDVNTLGGMLSYFKTLSDDERDFMGLKEWKSEEIVKFINVLSSGRGFGSVIQDGLCKFDKAVQTSSHLPISYDVRCAYNQGLISALDLDMLLPGGTLCPKRPLGNKASAIMAFYELMYSLALIDYGFIPLLRLGVHFSSFNSHIFDIPSLLRHKAKKFSIASLSSKDLLRKGLEISSLLGLEFSPLPSKFSLEAGYKDRSLPLATLISLFQSEYLRCIKSLKSKSESTDTFSFSNSANVGPKEERG